jgi:hypothetical protein
MFHDFTYMLYQCSVKHWIKGIAHGQHYYTDCDFPSSHNFIIILSTTKTMEISSCWTPPDMFLVTLVLCNLVISIFRLLLCPFMLSQITLYVESG